MASQRDTQRAELAADRVEALAAQLYVCLVTSRTGTTPAGSAKDALDRAETFWAEADARRARRLEKPVLNS